MNVFTKYREKDTNCNLYFTFTTWPSVNTPTVKSRTSEQIYDTFICLYTITYFLIFFFFFTFTFLATKFLEGNGFHCVNYELLYILCAKHLMDLYNTMDSFWLNNTFSSCWPAVNSKIHPLLVLINDPIIYNHTHQVHILRNKQFNFLDLEYI